MRGLPRVAPAQQGDGKGVQEQAIRSRGSQRDGDRSVLNKIIEKEGLNYRSAVDGSTHGAISTAWHVSGWPTVYVIDAKGVIRNKYVGVDPDELTGAVKTALKSATK